MTLPDMKHEQQQPTVEVCPTCQAALPLHFAAAQNSRPDRASGDWIAVSERLPEHDGEYACVVHFKARNTHWRGGHCHRPAYTTARWLEFAEGSFWLNGGVPPGRMISHWMALPPLPAPPQATAPAVGHDASSEPRQNPPNDAVAVREALAPIDAALHHLQADGSLSRGMLADLLRAARALLEPK